MRLHENKELFRQAIEFTAQSMSIPTIYVEKDYWVTYALHTLFNSALSKEIVFKGGTSLLKCYAFIKRFSEDIDLVVLRHEGESNSKMKTKLKEISEIVAGVLPEIEVKEVTQKMGMNRKTAHTYKKEFKGNYGQVRDYVVLESTWLGYFEPFSTRKINSFVYDMMIKTGQLAVAEEYGLLPFDVQVLDPERTICEKIMSLVRFSYGDNPIDDLKKKVRHTYDLHQLLQDEKLAAFFESAEFDTMLQKVGADDVESFKNNNKWLENHPKDALIYADLDEVWEQLSDTYKGDFRMLALGVDFPDDAAILQTLHKIKERIATVKWDIKIPDKM
ncbi:MAG: nucleotidyl transferase AbiEii/AbiGii toxin family protein [Bacteroidetes bacterium]|nr:nucleotidyl transferase AbiEii/AbiGii toxin family protein [Bacteroidota bacterium]